MTTTNTTAELVAKIETQLARLGWLCTDATPCYYCVSADADLPAGWVRVYDDNGEGFGPAEDVLADLEEVGEGAEYGEGCPTDERPTGSGEWPSELLETEQLEEGTANDEPTTLVTVQTNAGTRYAAGPHGVFTCALSEWIKSGADLAETREEAIRFGCGD